MGLDAVGAVQRGGSTAGALALSPEGFLEESDTDRGQRSEGDKRQKERDGKRKEVSVQ